MSIVNTLSLESNRQIKINFDGGDLSSDAGLLLIKEFVSKLDIDKLFSRSFKTNDSASFRYHTDKENLLQIIYMIIAGYFEDDASDELTNDPVFKAVLNKDALASQPTVSRFFNRMDEDTLNQFLTIGRILRKRVYSIQMPQAVILDLDSTLLDAYGKQEGRAFNFHYRSNGYHPLVCYDGMTGDLIKIQLRDGTQYSCTGVVDFLQLILDEYLNDYPTIQILLRGDSGFATPDLYKQCEENGTSYVIRLKENGILREKASHLVDELDEITRNNKVDYAVVYGEFMYKAGPWPYERRVVCKVEKPENQMVYMYTFVVTNMDSSPEYLIKFYCKRGRMENFIKESKSGFDFASVSSHARIVNANRLQVHALAYNIFNWFRRLALSANMRKQRIDTVLSLIHISGIRQLRDLMRYRFKLTCFKSSEKNRLQNCLTVSNTQLGNVVSDTFGKSAQAILDKILENPADTSFDLEPLVFKSLKKKLPELRDSIDGYITPEQAGKLKVIKSHYENLEARKAELEELILALATPYQQELAILQTAPGISSNFTAIGIISEIGTNMEAFPSAKHLCSWAGLTPVSYTHLDVYKRQSQTCVLSPEIRHAS